MAFKRETWISSYYNGCYLYFCSWRSHYPATKEVTYDDAYGTLADVTLLGYILSGWCLDEELTDEIDSETIVRKEDDHSLYAKLTPVDYSITYNNLDGGTNNEGKPRHLHHRRCGDVPSSDQGRIYL